MPTALPSLVSALTALALLAPASALAIPPKPAAVSATWGDGGPVWGRVVALPRVARPGDPVHIHGLVVGGPAADPWWSCSQYHGWTVNGTSGIAVVVPPTWSMNANASDNFGNKVATLERDGGELPPYGWEERVSDTCYCAVTDFGASGGCESREVQPEVFFTMDAQNPREGNVQFASPGGATGWAAVEARFTGYAGVGWWSAAVDYVYVLGDDADLADDSDGDHIADVWEIAHSPNQSLDDFGGFSVAKGRVHRAAAAGWVSPYAPRDEGWTPAAVGDWDGDGVSDRDEYERWRAGGTDAAGLPWDPTVINTARAGGDDGCCASAAGPLLLWPLALALGVAAVAAQRRRRPAAMPARISSVSGS